LLDKGKPFARLAEIEKARSQPRDHIGIIGVPGKSFEGQFQCARRIELRPLVNAHDREGMTLPRIEGNGALRALCSIP
jgi:hypothetical protein